MSWLRNDSTVKQPKVAHMADVNGQPLPSLNAPNDEMAALVEAARRHAASLSMKQQAWITADVHDSDVLIASYSPELDVPDESESMSDEPKLVETAQRKAKPGRKALSPDEKQRRKRDRDRARAKRLRDLQKGQIERLQQQLHQLQKQLAQVTKERDELLKR